MLRPTPSHSSLSKASIDLDVHSSNSDQPDFNSIDNSRPSSPAPTLLSSPRISFENTQSVPLTEQQQPLNTPPESPVKGQGHQSYLHPSLPPVSEQPFAPLDQPPPSSQQQQQQQHPLAFSTGAPLEFNQTLTSPPTSPTLHAPLTTLPPKLASSLSDHPLFRGCPVSAIHLLASRMHIRHYHPQDHIIQRSEQSSAMFYILRGTVKVASHDNEATYYEIKENNFFGDVGVLYRVPRSMDVLAKNRCTIAILSGDDLVKAMEQSPEMAKAIGYQTQERYQMYLKRRQSVSARRTLDGGTGGPDEYQDDAKSESFVKSDVHSAIRRVPLFQSCPSEVIHMLSLNVEPRTYNLGQSIIRRGEIGREMFFIASGVVEILSDDNLRVLARFHDGQFFGEIAVLLDVPRIANVKAVSQVEVFVLTKDNLEAVFKAVPGAAETITAEGTRLYKNWLLKNSSQCEETMGDGSSTDALGQLDEDKDTPMQWEPSTDDQPLSVPQGGLRVSTTQLCPGTVSPEARSSDISPLSASWDLPRRTSQENRRPSLDSIHPIESGHPAAISVLPMTFMTDYSRGHRVSTGQPMAPMAPLELESEDGTFIAMSTSPSVINPAEGIVKQQQSTSEQPGSFFDQNTGFPGTPDNSADLLASLNPTIRGIQQSNPKRRRASVAVWSQQDLMKLAEAAQAKVSIDTAFAPAVSSSRAVAFQVDPLEEPAVGQDPLEEQAPPKRSLSVSRKAPPKLLMGPATFQDLDEGLVVMILDQLPMDVLLRARRVCKNWNNLIMEHQDMVHTLDLSKYKKIATDALLANLCQTLLSRNPSRTKKVSLRDCFLVSDQGLAMLASHMPAVQDLDLHSCWNVTDAGFRALGMHCQELVSIDFSNCRKLGDGTIFGLFPEVAMTRIHNAAVVAPQEGALVEAVLGPQTEVHSQLEDTLEATSLSTEDISMDETQVLLTRQPEQMSPVTDAPVPEVAAPAHEVEPSSPLAVDMDYPKSTLEPQSSTAVVAVAAVPSGPLGCPRLARLNLSYCKNLTDKSFVHLSLYGSKQLESLNLQRCTTITPEAFISLDLNHKMAVNDKGLAQQEGSDIAPTTSGFNPLVEPCFPRLLELHLSDCTFLTDPAIVALAPNMPRLEVLSLSFCCALTDVAIEAVTESCPYLRKLDLSFCGSAVSDASLYQMAKLDAEPPGEHSLEELEIRGCVRVTEMGIRELLAGCPQIKRLNLGGCSGIGTADLSAMNTPTVPATATTASPVAAMSVHADACTDLAAVNPADPVAKTTDSTGHVFHGQASETGSLAAAPSSQANDLSKKMMALRKGKEWALAQQRPGLEILV